jgi:hypothetical protein
MAYPGISTPRGHVSAVATGVAGVVIGAAAGAGYAASRKLARGEDEETKEGRE